MNTNKAVVIALVSLLAILAAPAAGADADDRPEPSDDACPILETASYFPFVEVHEECLTSWP